MDYISLITNSPFQLSCPIVCIFSRGFRWNTVHKNILEDRCAYMDHFFLLCSTVIASCAAICSLPSFGTWHHEHYHLYRLVTSLGCQSLPSFSSQHQQCEMYHQRPWPTHHHGPVMSPELHS